ncbi:T9SS type A sorting domain-containing protein [Aurantibacillus circumpalustris]|uniref:T9SS type A sorting domain-containing protein n=1 Tax=Aurantibacillus circumpalustris TaxID=3036359 RepID=UPI00295A85EF|nr:T9SS type A sorting domain-containing protein [Aurantibacillus circumpalustris]
MKKLPLLKILVAFSICLLTTQSILGQTLTCATSCPKAGEVFSIRTSSPVLNTAGANQVWNFAVIPSTSPVTYQVSYIAASSVPAASLYPQANLVRTQAGNNTFLTSSSAGLSKAYPSTYSVTADPIELPLPFTYGDTYTQTIIYTSVVATDTLVTTWQNSFLGHGTGTLILPSGTFTNVLAIKYLSTWSTKKNGTLDGYIVQNKSYYYYSQNISYPLLYTRQLSESGPGDYGPYTEFMDHIVLGIKDVTVNDNREMTVFPNPASDRVSIKFSEITKGVILLRNSLGQQLIEQNYENGDINLNLAGLAEGLYTISFVDKNYTLNRKLVVSR